MTRRRAAALAGSLTMSVAACSTPAPPVAPAPGSEGLSSEEHCALAHEHQRRATELDREAVARSDAHGNLHLQAEQERRIARQHAQSANQFVDQAHVSRPKLTLGCATAEVSNPPAPTARTR